MSFDLVIVIASGHMDPVDSGIRFHIRLAYTIFFGNFSVSLFLHSNSFGLEVSCHQAYLSINWSRFYNIYIPNGN